MKGFIIKNTKTGKVYTGKADYVDNSNFDANSTWIDNPRNTWGNPFNNLAAKPPPGAKLVNDAEKEKWPMFYKRNSWTGDLERYATPFGSDGTNGPPWEKRVPNYWGTSPKVFTTKKAAQKILSTITQTYYKDRENETTALLYLPDHVHDFKVIAVEIIIKEIEDGTGIATTTSEPTTT